MNYKNPKVFIATPHADRKNYCLEQYIDVIGSLSYPNKTVMIADNSDTNKNTKMLVKRGFNAVHVKPKSKSNIQYICESHNRLRNAFLRSDADVFFHLESDIIPPSNIIEQLLASRKKVIGAPYFIGVGGDSHLIVQDMEEKFLTMRETKRMDDGSDILLMDGKLKKVHTVGLGCVMIAREVVEKVPFRYQEGYDAHPDSFFAHDLHMLEIPIWCDTSILCEHNNTEWTEFKKAQ